MNLDTEVKIWGLKKLHDFDAVFAGVKNGDRDSMQKAKQERAILERKAAAFDEIAGEIVGLYRAVNTVRACVDGDCDQYKVHLAMIDAMFSLGVVAQIIVKTKEDAA